MNNISDFKNKLTQEDENSIAIFQESSTDGKYEIIFTALPKNKYKNNIIDDYIKNNPITDISTNSLNFLHNTEKSQYYLFLSKIDKSSPFFNQDLEFIKKNKKNFISKKITNEIIDINKNFEQLFEKFTYRASLISIATIELAGEILDKSLKYLDENGKDFFAKSISKSNDTLNKGIAKFKNKFKI